jgi:hypothetical protein
MPYIKKDDRVLARLSPRTAGELNYVFTTIALQYLSDHGKNYQNINDIIGALEGCKLEFYRRLVASYEDIKIKDNGDVF